MLVGVTGTSGLLGSAVAAEVAKDGHSVKGIDRSEPKQEQGLSESKHINLTAYKDVLEALRGCEAVIHCAAIPSPGKVEDHETHNNNVTVSYNVLLACAELGIKHVCQMSSINAIGAAYCPYIRRHERFPIDETELCKPADPYSLSKMICELQAEAIVRAHPDMRIASLRPSMCLMDRVQPKSELAEKAVDDEAFSTKHDINDCWSWTYIPSLARCAILAITTEDWTGAEAFWTIAPRNRTADEGVKFSSLDLVNKYHPNASVREGWFDEDPGRAFFDCGKAEKMLGWKHG